MNGPYTEEELLLLSNFVYIPACLSSRPIGEIIDSFRDESGGFSEESVYAAAAGGGMSVADVKTVFTRMDERIRENPHFGTISVSRRLDEDDVRALCYTDEKDKDPVVVFRGTGGTRDAWTDNFEGAFTEDTKIQKIADDFVKNECAIYEDVVVTGHSKGGNLAQYVTVMRGQMISECLSFDGQGFGDDFIREYAGAIREAAPKIRSVSAYNDFVNILLTAIAGTCVYTANDSSPESAHSSVTLLTENEFDENGNITSIRAQGSISKELGLITGVLTRMLDPLKKEDKEIMSRAAGTAVSLALSTGREDLVNGCAAPSLGLVTAEFVKRMTGTEDTDIKPAAAGNVYIDVSSCKRAKELLAEQIPVMERTARSVSVIRQELAYTISSKICAEHALERTCAKLGDITETVYDLCMLIGSAISMYEKAEEEALMLMSL